MVGGFCGVAQRHEAPNDHGRTARRRVADPIRVGRLHEGGDEIDDLLPLTPTLVS
jgi:hypothetical protein